MVIVEVTFLDSECIEIHQAQIETCSSLSMDEATEFVKEKKQFIKDSIPSVIDQMPIVYMIIKVKEGNKVLSMSRYTLVHIRKNKMTLKIRH